MAYNQSMIKVKDLEEGDLIEFYRAMGTFSHWAVYIGNDEVIHFSPDPDTSAGKFNFSSDIVNESKVRRDDIKSVARGSYTYRNNEFDDELRPYSKEKIVQRAKEKLGMGGYNVATNNCEHFATYCRYGQRKSKQVNAAHRKTVDSITPTLVRAWSTGDWTELISPAATMLSDHFFSSPPGDLVDI